MDQFRIEGPARLQGEVETSGAKTPARPLPAPARPPGEPVHLTNLPDVRDVRTLQKLLAHIGVFLSAPPGEATVEAHGIRPGGAPCDLVKTMRASVLVLGPLLARTGHVRVSLPGGCAIGVRPIDLHLAAFRKFGAEVTLEHGYVEARAARLGGARIAFETVTVTGTENAMLAATLARGSTVLENAARAPEVADLARLLRAMGARIHGEGTETIAIEGVAALHGASHAVLPDRIEARTSGLAGAVTRGDVTVRGCRPEHLETLVARLTEAGVSVTAGEDWLRVRASGSLTP